MRTRIHNRRDRRAGFTLIELMFSLVIGAIGLSAVYAVVAGSTRVFHEQHRISRLQVSLQRAIAQVSRDVQRAGFLATPDIRAQGESCAPPGLVGFPNVEANLAGLADWREETAATTGVRAVQNAGLPEPAWAGVTPGLVRNDSIALFGNYETNSEYSGVSKVTPSLITIDPAWHAFERDFTNWTVPGAPQAVDAVAFREAFTAGRAIRISTASGKKHFAIVQGANIAGGATGFGNCPNTGVGSPGERPPCIRFTRPLPAGCDAVKTVAPMSFIRYRVRPAVGLQAPTNVAVTGANAQLQRVEMDPLSPGVTDAEILGAPNPVDFRVVADYVAFFNTVFIQNTNQQPNQDDLYDRATLVDPRVAPGSMRSVIIELALRSPIQDPSFPFVAGMPEQRYRVFNDGRPGAAHVRYARVEVFMPNVALGGL